MPNLTADDIDTLLNLTDGVSSEIIESWIDQAIDQLNLYGDLDISNMAGTAGSKTVSLESRERGAVNMVVRTVYLKYYKDQSVTTVAGLSVADVVMSDSEVRLMVKQVARQLAELDVSRG